MNLLAYLYRQSWQLMLCAVISGLLAGLSGAALAAVIGQGINVSGNGVGALEALNRLAWLFFGLCLLHLLTKSCSEIALLRLTQGTVARLRVDMSRKLLATSQKRLNEMGKPGLLVIMTKDIESFTAAFQWLPVALADVVIIGCCLGYIAWMSWEMFLLLALFLLLGIGGFHFAERRPLKLLGRVREQMDALYQHFRDLIEGSRELQLNARRGRLFIERVIATEAQALRGNFVASMTGYTMAINLGSVLFFVVIGLMLFVVPLWSPQPAAVLSTITLILLYLVRPISELVVAMPVVRQAGIALGRIRQLDDTLTQDGGLERVQPDSSAASSALIAGTEWRLELCGIRHRYPSSSDDRQFVLGPLDLTLKQGEILYIVGGNGSGKTTLAMLILGLYQPDEGNIRLNGQLITETHIDAYRQNFSAVFADFHLFEQLLDADDPQLHARANHYLQALGMAHKVKVVDGRYSTVNLSTGQRKRLALVSAYLEDRPIYLFDEWAADQDPAFKKVFYTELLPELKARGKTVIVITHDDAYFSCADRILKLQDGHAG
jgi:putative ATP-binding cassette transporter